MLRYVDPPPSEYNQGVDLWVQYSRREPLTPDQRRVVHALPPLKKSSGLTLQRLFERYQGYSVAEFARRAAVQPWDIILTGYCASWCLREFYFFLDNLRGAVWGGHIYYDPVRELYFRAPPRCSPDDVVLSTMTWMYPGRASGNTKILPSLLAVMEEISAIHRDSFNRVWPPNAAIKTRHLCDEIENRLDGVPPTMRHTLDRLRKSGVLIGTTKQPVLAVAHRFEGQQHLLLPANVSFSDIARDRSSIVEHLKSDQAKRLWRAAGLAQLRVNALNDTLKRVKQPATNVIPGLEVKQTKSDKGAIRLAEMLKKDREADALYEQTKKHEQTKQKRSPGRPKRDYAGVSPAKAIPLKIRDQHLKKLVDDLDALDRSRVQMNTTAIKASYVMLNYDAYLLPLYKKLHARHGCQTGNVIRLVEQVDNAVAAVYDDTSGDVFVLFCELMSDQPPGRVPGYNSPTTYLKFLAFVRFLRSRPQNKPIIIREIGWPVSIYLPANLPLWRDLEASGLISRGADRKTITCLCDARQTPYRVWTQAAQLRVDLDTYPELAPLVHTIESD